jgi:hypothetical protein
MASSSTSALSDEVMWEELPEELLRRVLEHVMLWRWKRRCCGGVVRGVSRRWRAVHDAACRRLRVRDGITDEGMHALCGRLPALTHLNLNEVTSLTEDGLRAVGGLATLSILDVYRCSIMTDAVLWELRGLTALTTLYLYDCTQVTNVGLQHLSSLTALTALGLSGTHHVTDVGLQHLSSLTALRLLALSGTPTTQAGQAALKAALPALTIFRY